MLAAFLGIVALSCQNEKTEPATFQAEGQIIGRDTRKCYCCSGWFLKTADTTFLFVTLPDGSGIDPDSDTYPIPVRFNYLPDTIPDCAEFFNRIIITDMEKR